jgi:fibronectin type 3 domain-containing protein
LETVCNVDNKPRLLVSYDLRGGTDGACDVSIDDASQNDKRISINSKCTNKSQFAMDSLDGQVLKNNTNYRLVMKNGTTCPDYVAKGQVTTNCSGTGQKDPTPTATSPSPSSGTAKSGFGTPESVNAKCEGNQDDPKITVSWHKVTDATSYIARLSNTQNGNAIKEETATNTSFTFEGIEKDKTYWYTVIAVDGSGKKSGATSNTRNIKCTNDNLQPSGVISAIAQSFQDMLDALLQ